MFAEFWFWCLTKTRFLIYARVFCFFGALFWFQDTKPARKPVATRRQTRSTGKPSKSAPAQIEETAQIEEQQQVEEKQ